jgi:transcriptional regulator with XRE-family HTH domain
MIDNEKIVTLEALGSRLRMMRQLRGLTQTELAERAGLAADTIRRAEKGEFSPSFTTMVSIASGMRVPVPALLCDGYEQADDLAEYIRALPPREFRQAVAVVKVLHEFAATGE